MHTVLFGGAFDPPTTAHHELIEISLAAGARDVWVLPTPSLHAYGKNTSLYHHRWLMIHLAFKEFGEKVHIVDTQPDALTYAWDTVNHLRHEHQDRKFVWAIGADHIDQLDKWYRGTELRELIPFWIYQRPSHAPQPQQGWYLEPPHRCLVSAPNPLSSTFIRENIHDVEAIRSGLHPEVLAYIQEQNLFVSQNTTKILL
jgi:nicotinate-nucleotide adenylyltransferase